METILKDFAKAWETLNPEYIIMHLSKDFQYDSQWVFESLDYNGYINYLRNKFDTLKNNRVSIKVEIVDDPYMSGKMLRLHQAGQTIIYRIKISNGMVVKGDLCMF